MATLKDIAAELGLSPATVSRALNGFPEVNAKTRAKVQDAARRLKYRPNVTAQRLVSGKSGMIGLILRNTGAITADPTFYEIIIGLSQQFAAQDLDLIFQAAVGPDELAPYERMIDRSGVDGFVLHAPIRNDPRIKYLQERGLPFVVHGKTDLGPVNYAFFDIDNHAAGLDATRLLLDLGHRRIAYVNGPEGLAFARDRRRGYLEALEAQGLAADPSLMRFVDMSSEAAQPATLALLDLPNPPTAIICASTMQATGVMAALAERGLRCPEDVSVIAHDDAIPTLRAVDFQPQLTVTRAPLRDACEPIARIMGQMLADPGIAPPQITQKADLIVRASTGPAPKET